MRSTPGQGKTEAYKTAILKYDPETKEEAVALRSLGMRYGKIAETLGMPSAGSASMLINRDRIIDGAAS